VEKYRFAVLMVDASRIVLIRTVFAVIDEPVIFAYVTRFKFAVEAYNELVVILEVKILSPCSVE
jgi:hypothetical protein